ncbi:MAG TPA: hypothetical protein VM600_09670, partial [Actinomycetota bacterium]|nr:hypothetical protein [Actinomycetota bacterium]
MSMASPSSRVRARVQDAAGIGDPLAYHTPGDGFFFSHPGRTVVGIGAASSAVVPAGPDQISR